MSITRVVQFVPKGTSGSKEDYLLDKDALRFATRMFGAQSAMTSGQMLMLL